MKSTIKKIFGYSAMMVGSAFVAGLTTYTLMQKNGAKETIGWICYAYSTI